MVATFRAITPTMYVSRRPAKSQIPEMHQLGITAVLNLSQKDDPPWDMAYLHDGQPDDGQPRRRDWWTSGINFALAAMKHGKVLIHCELGVSRSPSMAYAILRTQGHSVEEATHMVLSKVPGATIKYGPDYERQLGSH